MIRKPVESKTDEGPELALADPEAHETVKVMLKAHCPPSQIRICLSRWLEQLGHPHDS